MNRFCTDCGASLQTHESFCVKCGAKQTVTEPQENNYPAKPEDQLRKTAVQRPIHKAPRKKMSIRQKAVLSAAAVILITVVAGHFIMKSFADPEKEVLAVFNAIVDKDEKSFLQHITVPENVKYHSETYLDYIHDQNLNRFHESLKDHAKDVHADGMTRVLKHEDGTELLRIKEKKLLYIYPTIEISAIGAAAKIDTDLSDISVQLNGADYTLEGKPIKLGAFLPGDYTVQAFQTNEYVPNEASWIFPVRTDEKVNLLDLTAEQTMVELDGDQKDSIVYIDGVSTKKTIEQLGSIGPLFADTQIMLKAKKETPAGEAIVTAEQEATGGSYIRFDYPDNSVFVVKTAAEIGEETFDRHALTSFVKDFRNAYESALNANNFKTVEPFLAPGSHAYIEIKDFMSDLGNDYYLYTFMLNEVTDMKLTGGEANVSTYEEFYFENHKYDTVFYERDKQYDIQIDANGNYKIHKIHIFDTKRSR